MDADGKKHNDESENEEKTAFEADLRDFTFPQDIDASLLDMIDEVISRYKSYSEHDDSERIRMRSFLHIRRIARRFVEPASPISFTR